jgi:hypothetical protein
MIFLSDLNFFIKTGIPYKVTDVTKQLPVLFLQSRVGRGTCVTPTGGSSSSSSGGSGANTRSYNTSTGAAPVSRKLRTGKLPPTGEHPPPAAEAAAAPTAQIPLEKGKELHQRYEGIARHEVLTAVTM